MSLKKIESPTYVETLPVSKKKVTYRPFVRSERKAIMLAAEGGAERDLVESIFQLIRACTFDQVEPLTSNPADVEFIFMQIRNKSTGENLEVYHNCIECDNKTILTLNLADCKVEGRTELSEVVQLSENTWIELRCPTLQESAEFPDKPDEDELLDIFYTCTVKVIQDDEVVEGFTKEQYHDWVSGMTEAQTSKIEEFFAHVPQLVFEQQYSCTKCNKENHIRVEGLSNFFE